MRTETVFRESEKPPCEAQNFLGGAGRAWAIRFEVLLRVKLRRTPLAEGSRCNGKNPTCVQDRVRRRPIGADERVARGEWQHSSQMHDCHPDVTSGHRIRLITQRSRAKQKCFAFLLPRQASKTSEASMTQRTECRGEAC